ncbi:MAG TPA: hypothetical protein PKZ84_06660 [Anaerolineae bacterium]|nr:hypothetical protein [Anaerolineae bacterium]HQI83368.1 hypothetical protein [Anaerolineae bacterium]
MVRSITDNLFSEGDLIATLNAQAATVSEKVNGIPKDQFLMASDDDLVERIQPSLFVEPIKLYEDEMTMESEESKIDVSISHERNPFNDRGPIYVPSVRVTVSIPFTGDAVLWQLRPSSWTLTLPSGQIRQPSHKEIGSLDIIIEQPTDSPADNVKQQLDRDLSLIQRYLKTQESDVQKFNMQLDAQIRQAIRERRVRLQKQEGVVKSLNIPLKKKDGVPGIQPIRVEKRLVRPLPQRPRGGYKPEPGITDSDYEDILTIIRHEGRTFETTPATYTVLNETDLRNILLAHLNGHYKGAATGETFRNTGKTDIRIEAEDRSAFVAECKIWHGAKELTAAVDQLLGYLTWRDCKCAIILFNKHNAKFSNLLEETPKAIQQHQRLYRDLGQQQESGIWRYIFSTAEDNDRRIIVQVFLFDLYVTK